MLENIIYHNNNTIIHKYNTNQIGGAPGDPFLCVTKERF